MQKPASTHSQFFTSLKRLEKRLKLENHQAPPSTLPQPPPPPPPITVAEETDSLGTPIYLNNNLSPTPNTNPQESEAPPEFLSRSPDFPPSVEVEERVDRYERFSLDVDDDIELLMQLLRLSDTEVVNDMGCDDQFYDKIVGVKGPKSANEAKRMEPWIKYLSNGETKEPFRLAHLLLGKAAFVHSGDDGFDGLVFPSTIDEFLQNDPPND